jgi:hypothetical protein
MRFAEIRRDRGRPRPGLYTGACWISQNNSVSDSLAPRRNGRIALGAKNSSYSGMDTVVAVR